MAELLKSNRVIIQSFINNFIFNGSIIRVLKFIIT